MDPRGTLRTLLILLAVFVGLMIAYWRWGTPEEGSQERPSLATLYRFRPEAIQEIRISYADGRSAMAFRREATGWVLLEPVRAPALQEKVDELIELFRRPIRRRIPESDDSAFGLDRPTVRVELSLEDGTRRELLLGRKGVTFSLYLRERSDSGAVLVESWYLDRLTQPVEAFRERRLWSGSREQVARLVVHPPGEAPIVLERSSPAQVWRLLAVDDLADSERVEALLQLLSDVSILEFLEDNRSDFSAWTENRAVISLSLQTFGGAEERFLFWPEGEGRCRIAVPERGAVYRVELGDLSALLGRPEDWRDRHLTAFQRVATDRIELLGSGGERVVLERGRGGRWSLIVPVRREADTEGVQSRLSRLDAAEVLRFLPNRSSLEPVLRLRLWDGTPPDGFTEIAFGPPEREGRTVRSSRRPGAIGVVSEELFHDWPLDPAAYRDRTALQLDLGAVQRVEVVRGARRAAWVREGLTWRVAEPAGAVGGSDALEELLGLLERLRVERWSARPPSEGWSPPYGSVRVVLRNLQERRLLLGPPVEGGLRWSRLEGDPDAFLLTDGQVRRLLRPLEALRIDEGADAALPGG